MQNSSSYNIACCRSTGAEFHGAFEEDVIAIVELEDVKTDVVTFDQRDARVYRVKVTTEYIAVLAASEIQSKYLYTDVYDIEAENEILVTPVVRVIVQNGQESHVIKRGNL